MFNSQYHNANKGSKERIMVEDYNMKPVIYTTQDVHNNYGSTSLSFSVSRCLIASHVFSSQSGLLEMYFGRKSRYAGSLIFLMSSTLISTFPHPQKNRNSQQLDFSPRNSLGNLSPNSMIGGGWNRDLPEGCRIRGFGKAGSTSTPSTHSFMRILAAFSTP